MVRHTRRHKEAHTEMRFPRVYRFLIPEGNAKDLCAWAFEGGLAGLAFQVEGTDNTNGATIEFFVTSEQHREKVYRFAYLALHRLGFASAIVTIDGGHPHVATVSEGGIRIEELPNELEGPSD